MRVTVCELSDDMEVFAPDWQALVAHVQSTASQLVVLPEMTFAPWFAWRKDYDPQIWQAGVDAHEQWIPRLDELAPAVVLGSRPVNLPVQGQIRRINQGFTWRQDVGLQPRHEKYYLPDNEGFYEASWYHPGNGTFQPAQVGEVKVGFMVCTDLWFMQHARSYGQQGIHVLACPRATGKTTLDKWLVGGRAAAVISGAYCLSSNRICADDSPATLGGRGWIIDPDGEVLGLTSARQPFITLDIDLARAERAKTTYPRYVKE
jgi:N-carbamoylputrescine amidase